MRKLSTEQLASIAAASVPNPPSGFITLFNDGGTLKVKDSAGVVTSLGAGGGGNDSRLLVARKTTAQTITSTTAADVADLFIPLAASATYYVYFAIPITTVTGTSPTLTLSFSGPTAPTLVSLRRRQMTTATAEAQSVITSFAAFAAAAQVANTFHIIEGIVVNGLNAGNLQLRAAAGGTVPVITIPAGASAYAIKTA